MSRSHLAGCPDHLTSPCLSPFNRHHHVSFSARLPVSKCAAGDLKHNIATLVPFVHTRRPSARPLVGRQSVSAKLPGYSSPLKWPAADNRDPWRLYTVLGLTPNVEVGEIKSAYRQLARLWHPDVCQLVGELTPEECTRRFIEVQEAYETLVDPQRKVLYDYEMRHPSFVKRGGGLGRRRPWQKEGRPWEGQCQWSNLEEQVGSQLNGLQKRMNNKPGSWAATMAQGPDVE